MNILNSLPDELQNLAESEIQFTEEQYEMLLNAAEELRRQRDEIYTLSDDLDRYLNEINELRDMVEEYRADIECLDRTGKHR
ncbi:MAG TPA: hypothetical protein VEP90_22545 [Methylomirabilota bacterium]|nr:hypothetical protein [Methylomirabilota bacterium]